jgi:hypothetical protein
MISHRPIALVSFTAFTMLSSSCVLAQTNAPMPPHPGDFAHHLPLTVTGQNGVVKLSLPLDVYQHAQQADLSDVRIFSSQGSPMPFTFVDEPSSHTVQRRESDAKLFPVRGSGSPIGGNLELDIRAAQDGSVLSVQAKQRSNAPASDLQAIVLDLGKSSSNSTVERNHESLDSLQFVLPADTRTYRAELAIEQSDDLKLWTRVAQSRVDWLQSASQSDALINDRIELSSHPGRYLRVQWIDGTPLQFSRVIAHWRSTQVAADPMLELKLTAQPGRFANDLVYLAGPALMAHEIGLDIQTINTVLPISIGYYRQTPPPKRDWQFYAIANNTFYRLMQNGSERAATRMHIHPQALNEWVVRGNEPLPTSLTMVLRIKPRTVVFTAQGGAKDFILAVGAERDQLNRWSTSETSLSMAAPGFSLSEISKLETAQTGSLRASSTETATKASSSTASDTAVNKRSMLLWGVLLFGVLLLAGMSWRLYKQMQASATQ